MPVLYGRVQECAELTAVIEAAARSESGVRVLVGEPGIGKTALLNSVTAHADGFAVLCARGTPSEARLPYAGLHRLLRPVTELIGGLPAPQRTAIRAALGQEDGPAPDRFLVSVAVLGLLSELAEKRPVLVVVDDAHWLDAPSLDALAFAAARFQAEGIALLAATRPEPPEPFSWAPVMTIGGLEPAACEQLIRARSGGPVAGPVLDRLITHTGGNPLALLEIAERLSAAQLAGRAPLPRPLPVGPALERAYLERVSALPVAAQRLLLLAAADDEIDAVTLLRAASHAGIDASALEAAEAAGLIRVSETRVRFRHPLIRSAVYQGAGLARRRWAHQVLGEVAARDDRRAWHRAAAALHPDAGLADELERSAGRARVRSGYTAAAAAMERAAELTPDDGVRARRLVRAAWDRWLGGHADAAVGLLDQARRAAEAGGRAGTLGEIDLLRGMIGLRGGVARDAYQSLVSAADRLGPEEALHALTAAAEAAFYAGDQLRFTAAAARIGRLGPVPGERAALIRAYFAGMAHAAEGEIVASIRQFRTVLEIAGRIDDPDLLRWAATAALMVGDDTIAHALPARAVDIARARGAVTKVPQAIELLVHSELWTGRLAIARANALEGLRLATQTGQLNCAGHLRALLALHAAIEGDVRTCRERAQEALARAREHDLGLVSAVATWALAFSDLSLGRYGEAADRLTRMAEAGPGHGHPVITVLSAPHYVEAAVRSGDHDRAARALAMFRSWAEAVQSAWALALVERCRALLADPAAADGHYRRALELHAVSARDFERARTALLYGAHLRRQRRRAQARRYTREALEIFERLGATRWAERARGELRAAGETVTDPEGEETGALTAQQLQIARFIAEGATNREVAARLFISPRTVDYHVRNIFAKLGIGSRVELVRRFRASGTARV